MVLVGERRWCGLPGAESCTHPPLGAMTPCKVSYARPLRDWVLLLNPLGARADLVKFNFPGAWTLAVLAWQIIEFGAGFAASGQLPYALDNLRWGADFLMRSHLSDTLIVAQVGPELLGGGYGLNSKTRGSQTGKAASLSDACVTSPAGASARCLLAARSVQQVVCSWCFAAGVCAAGVLQHMCCSTCRAAGVLQHVLCSRRSATGGLQQVCCSRCRAAGVVQQAFCSTCYAAGVVQQAVCTKARNRRCKLATATHDPRTRFHEQRPADERTHASTNTADPPVGPHVGIRTSIASNARPSAGARQQQPTHKCTLDLDSTRGSSCEPARGRCDLPPH
jgi:hypothetical protein